MASRSSRPRDVEGGMEAAEADDDVDEAFVVVPFLFPLLLPAPGQLHAAAAAPELEAAAITSSSPRLASKIEGKSLPRCCCLCCRPVANCR